MKPLIGGTPPFFGNTENKDQGATTATFLHL